MVSTVALVFYLLSLLLMSPITAMAFPGEPLLASSTDLKVIKIAAYKATPWPQWGGRIVHIIRDKNELLTSLNRYDILILDGFATARMDADEINAVKMWVQGGGVTVFIIRPAPHYTYAPGHYKMTITDVEHLDKDAWGGIYNISLAESTTNWVVKTGTGTISLDTTSKVEGSTSVRLEGTTTPSGYLGMALNVSAAPLDLSAMAMLKLYVRANTTVINVIVRIFDVSGNLRAWSFGLPLGKAWSWICIPLNFTHHTDESPDLSRVAYIEVQVLGSASTGLYRLGRLASCREDRRPHRGACWCGATRPHQA
ncbi:hypothetical protein DRO60_03310 [Candidatus Bathyarchaeota archaeon]|nr:MAG: hypothetical protein DRO60_03310 [Candidatus Bathyarchaeota archaeon]